MKFLNKYLIAFSFNLYFQIIFGKLFGVFAPMKLRIGLLFTILFFFGKAGIGQELKDYEGGYTFNNLRGNARFSYYLTTENQPILDGPFTFEYKKLDSLTKDNLKKLDVRGEFVDYEKDKAWSYRLEEHRFSVKDIRDRQIVGELQSVISELNSNYQEGRLDGKLDYSEKTWLNEAYLETFKTGDLNFVKDRLTGKVVFENFQPDNFYKIAGNLSTEGLMDGAWDFEYMEDGLAMKEIRRYEKGFLIGLQKNDQVTGEKLQEVVFFDAIEKLDSLNQGFDVEYSLSDQFFGLTFDDGFAEQSKEYRQQFSGTKLLEDALVRILKFEEDKFLEDGKLVKSPIQTRRFRYDLSKEETEGFEKSLELYGQLNSFLELTLNSNFLKLNQNSSDSLAFSIAYFDHIAAKLENLEPIFKSIDSGEINYFDQTYLKENIENLISGTDTLSYEYHSKKQVKILENEENDASPGLADDLNVFLETELERFRTFDLFISKQQQAYRQNQNLASIEKTILDRKKRVDSLHTKMDFDSPEHRELVDAFYKNLATDQYQSLLDEYNQLESFEAKAMQGDVIVDLLRFTTNRMGDLGKVVNLNDWITELFTVKTFDPFTFETDFEVVEQRNLYQAAITLSRFEYKGLMTATDYQVAEGHLINLENLMVQLTKLRQKDTRKLERELVLTGGNINQLKKLLSL